MRLIFGTFFRLKLTVNFIQDVLIFGVLKLYMSVKMSLNWSLVFTVLIFVSCGGTATVENETSSNEARKIDWVLAEDLDFKNGETILVEGYLNNVLKTEGGVFYLYIGARHNSGNESGQIKVELKKDLFTGNAQLEVPYTNNFDDTIYRTVEQFYLVNEDTITNEFIHRSKIMLRAKVDSDEPDFGAWELELDSLYKVDRSIEKDYSKAIPLTSEFALTPKEEVEQEFTYVFIDGSFSVPGSVSGSSSYTLKFVQDEDFYRIYSMPVNVGEVECGKVCDLALEYFSSSVVFWDAELNEFGCNDRVRVYGIWNNEMKRFTIEEFKRIS